MLPLSAQAAGNLSYSYVELDYNRASIDGLDADPDGFTLKGSAAVGEQFYLFGSYFSGSDSIEGLDLDYDQTQLGLGYHHALSDRSDFLAEISYMNAKVAVEDFDVDGDGYRVSVGFRGLMADNFEGYIKGNWDDGSDVDGDIQRHPRRAVQVQRDLGHHRGSRVRQRHLALRRRRARQLLIHALHRKKESPAKAGLFCFSQSPAARGVKESEMRIEIC